MQLAKPSRDDRAGTPAAISAPRRQRDGGYLLIAILFMMVLMIMAALAVLPAMVQQIKRDREEEMIHRGTEYARAIKKYYKKFGRYPANLEQLDNTNQIRFLRKRYTDPLAKDGKWKLLNYGDVAALGLGLTQRPVGVPAAALGGNIPNGAQYQGQQSPALVPTNPNGPLASGNQNSQDNSSKGDQNGQPADGGASSGPTPNQPVDTSNPNSPSPSSSNPGGNNNGQDASGGQTAGQGFGSAQPGSSSGFGNSANQTFGAGAIVGVASTSKDPTIRIFNKKKKYNEWMFIYNPQDDRVGVLLKGPYQPSIFGGANGGVIQGAGQPGQPAGAFGNGAPGINQPGPGSQPEGFGQPPQPQPVNPNGPLSPNQSQ